MPKKKKDQFVDCLDGSRMHFGDIALEERDRIILDNKMCLFCLLHKNGKVCFQKVTNRKPPCKVLECNEEHIEWLYKVLKAKILSVGYG
jgi:hypothetical protein